MADIKQAVAWLKDGKKVKRLVWSEDVRDDNYHRPWTLYCKPEHDKRVMTVSRGGNNWDGADFTCEDLLAEDWVVSE